MKIFLRGLQTTLFLLVSDGSLEHPLSKSQFICLICMCWRWNLFISKAWWYKDLRQKFSLIYSCNNEKSLMKYRKNFIVLFQSLASNLVLKRGSLTWRKRWIWKHLSRFHLSNCSTFLLRHCWETIKTKAWINGPRVGTKSQLLLYFIFGRNVRAWLRNQSEFY